MSVDYGTLSAEKSGGQYHESGKEGAETPLISHASVEMNVFCATKELKCGDLFLKISAYRRKQNETGQMPPL